MMRKSKTIATIAATAMIGLAGCMSTGNETLKDQNYQSMSQILSEGMTQVQVREAVGDPMSVSFTDSGNEIWTYEFIEGQMTAQSFIPIASMFSSGMKGKKKQLVILFDESQTLQRFTMSDSDYQSKSGIIRQ